jgi:hypothetical protein
MQESSKESLEQFVSLLGIPGKVVYLKKKEATHMMQTDIFGGQSLASEVVKKQTKNNSVKSQAKRKVRTSDEATIAFINSVSG